MILLGCNRNSDLKPKRLYGTVKAQDSVVYKTIKIETIVWMAENLRTTVYNDGTVIPSAKNTLGCYSCTTGSQCTYNMTEVSDSIKTFGRFYNYYAIKSNKLCPKGWHVPTELEWDKMENYLMTHGYSCNSNNIYEIAKSLASDSNWKKSVYTDAIGYVQSVNNRSGFNAEPAGYLNNSGSFVELGISTHFGTSSSPNGNNLFYHILSYDDQYVKYNFADSHSYLSVRCVKE